MIFRQTLYIHDTVTLPKPSKREQTPKMARDFFAGVGAHADDAGVLLECFDGLLLLGKIIMSPSNYICQILVLIHHVEYASMGAEAKT